MKLILIILLFIIPINQKSISNESLLGLWSICKLQYWEKTLEKIDTINKMTETNFAVCQKIIFYVHSNGEIIYAGKSCSFHWNLNNDTVIFSFESKKERDKFISNDTVFTCTSFQKGESQILELTNSQMDFKTILNSPIKRSLKE